MDKLNPNIFYNKRIKLTYLFILILGFGYLGALLSVQKNCIFKQIVIKIPF
jgi:hypothetical protein